MIADVAHGARFAIHIDHDLGCQPVS